MLKKIKILKGCVSSNKMDKSAVVCVERLVKHKFYGKFVKRTTKLHVHDQDNKCNIGDIVEISECKPISKTKSWILLKIVKKNLELL
ncbi:30S ribosomal protein S17 [Buchnera aphidicola (Nipponaphis monzeni)]|uniref:Small ribosomal subunit protein uS17 n=1 Tax=Buchnera aphidicola (Nipponaphis monzeni) TaxID=2495405 RepID=A0A455TAP8_9GAMM|nr:30S ribosomal protein S17 [Buchnera aphidicola]BBI01392.1 30S ribosomal protein S17 [Buchnera aphidicola (Nipponaphis monzeni)]